jgi:hypothetical protein
MQMTEPNQTISWGEILTFLSPAGQQQLVDFVRQAQEDRGANWLPEIQAEFPMFSWIVELVCTKTPAEAFADLQAEFPSIPLRLVENQLHQLHGTLRAEIERKR